MREETVLKSTAASPMEQVTMRKVTWRVLPYLMICYLVSYIDRVNVGFAAIQMREEMRLDSAIFGIGASLFLVTYCLFAVPSNAMLRRVGARKWITFLMVVWGCLSMGMCFISGPTSFYIFRLLLGAAEAGFLPGVIFYIAQWFPTEYRGRISAWFLLAIPGSSFLGSPISVGLMQFHHVGGLSGWQWLFLMEGFPAALLGIGFLFLMQDAPKDARWLAAPQRQWLQDTLEAERRSIEPAGPTRAPSMWRDMTHPAVLALSVVYAGVISIGICLSFWQPQIIKSFGLSTFDTGLLNAIPFGVAILAMIVWGRSSDHFNDRVWHTFIPLVLSGVALCGTIFFHSLSAVIIILTLALVGTYAAKGPFWAMVTEWLPAGVSATGIGMVSAVGSIAAAASTYLLGIIQKETGSFALALLPLIVLAALASVVLVISGMRYQSKTRLALLNAASEASSSANARQPSSRSA